MPNLSDDAKLAMTRRILSVEKQLRESGPTPFGIDSETTLAEFTADQNALDPGNFDVVRVSSNAARSINGIMGGIKGRWLTLINVGRFNITIVQQSSSATLNSYRILSSASANISLGPNKIVRLYYDFTTERWRN